MFLVIISFICFGAESVDGFCTFLFTVSEMLAVPLDVKWTFYLYFDRFLAKYVPRAVFKF
ncbi:hypothetical protein [Bacillus cereus]|uniref:hypothetical protein n=1 Tax=Bacillus cereus TaxID=1396 RepID=UPI000308E684|nr:hypothetical protein [Bacillus cereus]